MIGVAGAPPSTGKLKEIVVRISDPRTPANRQLIEHLWIELGTMYGDTGPSRYRPEDFVGQGIAFVTAYRGEEAVGCGAVRPFDAETPKIGEIKRMFVEPAARGLGISRQILARLEEVGRDLGYEMLRLETGIKQPAALHLYEASGYKRIECYGEYRNDPNSICFEKRF